ncbi:MAG: hypothetical protein AAGL68_03940 [Pseudomonadota bacterium]
MVPWKKVRLELGPTDDLPTGSVSRAYLLQLPLRENGHIDGVTLGVDPLRATARRFWTSEADQSGYVVQAEQRWRLVQLRAGYTHWEMASFADCAINPGEVIEFLEAGQFILPFVVADMQQL